MTEQAIDAEVIESTELVAGEDVGSNLFHADDPADVITKATAIANALTPVIREQGMVSQIQGKDHVNVEGWATLGAMLGVTPVTTKTTKLENGWEAEVEARTLDGRVIGRAESMCTRDEKRWEKADEYAIRSMAQTRATSRALASPLRFVVTLAGFAGTPAEEMPREGFSNGGGEDQPASEKQEAYLKRLFADKQLPAQDQLAIVQHYCDGPKLTKSGASQIIEALKEGKTEELRQAAGLGAGTATAEAPADDADLPAAEVTEEDGQIKADGVPF